MMTIINVSVPNRGLKYMKENIVRYLKGKKYAIKFGDIIKSLKNMLEEFRKSIKTDLETIIKYLDPLDIYRRFTSTNYGIYFSCIFYILKLFHTLGHEIGPNTFKNLDNLKYSFSDHNKIKLEINIITNLENNSKF